MPNINKKLYSDIEKYCKINDINDVDKFCNILLERAFTAEKYGNTPQITPTKVVEKKVEKSLVYEPENSLSLQDETTELVDQPVEVEVKKEEIVKDEPPKKVFKKANLNDDYKIYDI